MTYAVSDVVNNLQNSLGLILLGGAIIFVGYYLYYGEAIRLGFRHQTHAVPLFANMYFFAHDVIFISLFRRWFYEVDHWLYRAFWFGLVAFTVLELIVHYQTVRFSQQALFPALNQRQYWLAYGATQLAIGVLFWFIYSQIDDFLFLISFASTVIVSVALMLPLLHGRGSARGQSRLLATSLIISPVGFFFVFLPAMSSYFLSLPYLLVGVTTVVVAIVYWQRLSRYPPYSRP